METAVLTKAVGEGLAEKLTYEQRLKDVGRLAGRWRGLQPSVGYMRGVWQGGHWSWDPC